MGQGRHRRAEVHEGRRAGARHADLHAQGAWPCWPRIKGGNIDLATIPAEDPRTYDDDPPGRHAGHLPDRKPGPDVDAAAAASRAPITIWSSQVAIVRPGPIQGDMVHPYLRRRDGLEPVEYPRPELEKVLGKTLGVPLFQEQAMRSRSNARASPPGEADMLRKSMATFKFTGGVSAFRDKLIDGMVAQRL